MADDVTEQPGTPARTPVRDRRHPLHVFAGRLTAALDDLAAGCGSSLLSLGVAETVETVLELTVAVSRLRALQLAAVAHADELDVARVADAASTAAWLRTLVPVTGPGAVRDVRLATALTRDAHEPTAAAVVDGRVLVEQAAVVLAAVDTLPSSVSVADRRRAEVHLVDLAADHDAVALKALGRHLLEVVDPDAADADLAHRLAVEEAAAARRTSLVMVDDGHGSTNGRFRVPTLAGDMLRAALQALAGPSRPDPIARVTPTGQRRPSPEVLGEAFVQYLERFPADNLPTTGGVAATVVVTIPLETLEGRLAAGNLLGTRHQLSPAAARRLACAAGVIPAVLDGTSRVLDLGRRSRTATAAQRLALALDQDGTCAVETCDRPTSWADAHHWKQRWTDGGKTNLDDLVLLCRRHHTLTHLPGRTLTPRPGGRYRIQRE